MNSIKLILITAGLIMGGWLAYNTWWVCQHNEMCNPQVIAFLLFNAAIQILIPIGAVAAAFFLGRTIYRHVRSWRKGKRRYI